MNREEARARWICCPMCDKKKCERQADDCEVKVYLKNEDKNEKIFSLYEELRLRRKYIFEK